MDMALLGVTLMGVTCLGVASFVGGPYGSVNEDVDSWYYYCVEVVKGGINNHFAKT